MQKTLGKRIIGKFVRMITLLIGISLIAFLLVEFSPIDPVQAYVGSGAVVSEQQQIEISQRLHLDQEPLQRYGNWVEGVLHGDFGESYIYRQPVKDVLKEKFTNSLFLMLVAWVLSGIIGFILGIVSAVKKGRWQDKLIKGVCVVLSSTPTFWFGLLLLTVFSVILGWLPIGFSVPIGVTAADVTWLDKLPHLILPALTLSIIGMPNIALHTREKMLDVLNSDYVLYAKARGESRKDIIIRHGLRNIALPALTLQFASIGEIFGGSILVEQVFSYPGMGQAAVAAGLRGDLPLLLAVALVGALFVFFGNLVADILYEIIDPGIRNGQKGASELELK